MANVLDDEQPVLTDYDLYFRFRATLAIAAFFGRDKAFSYRGFTVGAAVLAWNPTNGNIGIFTGGNQTAFKGDPNKSCAEKNAIAEAARCGYTNIIAFSVVGPQQADDATGIAGPTLRPCATCRSMMNTLPGITDDTIILTINPDDSSVHEEFTVKELIELHLAQR